jgi:hypothetical protein
MTVVAIETPPIQITTAKTCKARARAMSSMSHLIAVHEWIPEELPRRSAVSKKARYPTA